MELLAEVAGINNIEKKIIKGLPLTKEEAIAISEISGPDIFDLFASANRIRQHFKGNTIGLCSIVNAKSGACSEDCVFCAQSSKSKSVIEVYPLLDQEKVIQKAIEAKHAGIKRFSIVTSGKKVSEENLSAIAEMISGITNLDLLACASLGLLNKKELSMLKAAGLKRYHHNLETSEKYFPLICSTHTLADKMETIEAAKSVGLSVCSGGIFGLGETWQDRIDMAFSLKELDVDSVPINFLIPIQGTDLAHRKYLHPFDALKIISLYRFILPQKEIRICGGRIQILGEFNSMVFPAGADGIISGNYLTTSGRNPEDDHRLIETYGFTT
jgi:biotin synthase